MHAKIENDKLSISVKKIDYNKDTVYKCFYWYGDRFDVTISEETSVFNITLLSKEGTNVEHQLISKIKQDLIDFGLRDIVNKETKAIRELLIAKAFSHYADIDPQTEISDPVGFSPTNIQEHE